MENINHNNHFIKTMKSANILSLTLLLLLASFTIRAQQQAPAELLPILNQLPALNSTQEKKIYKELLSLGDDQLSKLAESILPNGNVNGVKARYAVSLLTHGAATKEDKSRIARAYLSALKKSDNVEVRAYLITNLKLVGSDASIAELKPFIADKDLYDYAVSTIVTIGGDVAREALLSAIKDQPADIQSKVVKTLGQLKYAPAVDEITKLSTASDPMLARQALWAMAMIADARSAEALLQQAKKAGYKNDASEATVALVEYMHQQTAKGNFPVALKVANAILENSPDSKQQHLRLAALSNIVKADAGGSSKILAKELSMFDIEYQREVLKLAASSESTPAAQKLWIKEYKKSKGPLQGDILSLLAKSNKDAEFTDKMLLPALNSSNHATRIAAAESLGRTRSSKLTGPLLEYLLRSTDSTEVFAAQSALLQVADSSAVEVIGRKLTGAQPTQNVALLKLLATRRATAYFNEVSALTASTDPATKAAALNALPYVASRRDVPALIKMLAASQDTVNIKSLQKSLVAVVDENSIPIINSAYLKDRIKFAPILPYVNDSTSINKIALLLLEGNEQEKAVAFTALQQWQNKDAVRTLIEVRKDPALKKYHTAAFEAVISQVAKSDWPDDQKLLMLREIMPLAGDKKEKTLVLRAAGNMRTFLSLIFISGYLDDAALAGAASRSAMQVSLPTSDARPGMTGIAVRNVLEKMLDKLTGEDSQYERIDILTYLEKLPFTKGFEPIFNGKDLSGWQGLVENPIVRSKLTKEALAKKQKEANAKVKDNWRVQDGMIIFQGDGANLCTTRSYGDFEMIVDWKISRNGDSGIYLRGSPQVQIWDTSRVDAGAQVGSGGLYNNQKARSTPLVVADNPIGEWNTFHIRMIGQHVTVFLNGVLVVDSTVMENYWDRNIPIFPEDAIELQAHGTELAFRNIYVKELNVKPYLLSKQEAAEGYEILFNGTDLDKWIGNKTDYVIEENTIAIYPGKESHGNLFTEKEYGDFIFRFEFQLTPGANNGLGIHAPLEGDAAYVGKEIQILDNTSPQYEKLQMWQYHGSVYGILPAKRDFLKPVGEWNHQEVYVKGDHIKVTLNGTVIVDGDLKKASQKGTLDHKEHPGLTRHDGHIGFLGHGSVVKFKNIRIREITN
ncbi:MAG: family 16 glycoside hydrolase [Chryseolinea sp.]